MLVKTVDEEEKVWKKNQSEKCCLENCQSEFEKNNMAWESTCDLATYKQPYNHRHPASNNYDQLAIFYMLLLAIFFFLLLWKKAFFKK